MHIQRWTCYIISMPSGKLVPKWSSNHNIRSVLSWRKSTANTRVARWSLFPLYVYLSIKIATQFVYFISIKNLHETCCILLSNPRFDGQIFVVSTVNKLPQAKRLLVLEQSLDLASVDQGLQDVITRQVPMHKLHALLANLKRLVRGKLSLTLPVGLLAFHLAFGGWKVERILTLHLLLSFFSGSYLGVFENFAKKDKVPRMVPSIAQVVFVTSPKALREPQLPTSMACMWRFG
jgi:hypothetical protein